jgi:hypothetical protein
MVMDGFEGCLKGNRTQSYRIYFGFPGLSIGYSGRSGFRRRIPELAGSVCACRSIDEGEYGPVISGEAERKIVEARQWCCRWEKEEKCSIFLSGNLPILYSHCSNEVV